MRQWIKIIQNVYIALIVSVRIRILKRFRGLEHLYFIGVDQSYTNWIFHGKTIYNISPKCKKEEELITFEGFSVFETIKMIQVL